MIRKKWLLIFSIFLSITTINAADIKGKVNATNAVTKIPYAIKGINLDLYKDINGVWKKITTFITNHDGMYYFKNIKAGSYTIQVNGHTNYHIKVLEQPQQEIAPIVVKY